MNLLKAQVNNANNWWQIELLDLDVVADGASEQEMLRNLSFSLIAEYHFARKHGKTPFVDLIKGDPEKIRSWKEGGKTFRQLDLPLAVSEALAAIFHEPLSQPYAIAA